MQVDYKIGMGTLQRSEHNCQLVTFTPQKRKRKKNKLTPSPMKKDDYKI